VSSMKQAVVLPLLVATKLVLLSCMSLISGASDFIKQVLPVRVGNFAGVNEPAYGASPYEWLVSVL
jgi:hypothetical protein